MMNSQVDPTIRHGLKDDIQGQFFSVIMLVLGVTFLHGAGIIMGQVVGIASLASYATGLSFGAIFFWVNVPFYLLAILRLGWKFTLNTIVAVIAVSFLTSYSNEYIVFSHLDPGVAAFLSGLCVGIGLIGLFRHNSSCGGIGILAVYIQDKTGIKAGWLHLALDLAIFAVALLFMPFKAIIYSLISTITTTLLISWNHRRDWYVAR